MEKTAFFMIFHEFENFFERVFALNNFFSFSKKITFWGEHLKKKTWQIKFFQIYSRQRLKKIGFFMNLFLKNEIDAQRIDFWSWTVFMKNGFLGATSADWIHDLRGSKVPKWLFPFDSRSLERFDHVS